MVISRKKICLLISSAVFDLQPNKLNDWLKQMPELSIIADIDPVFIFGGPAVDITPEIWLKLAEAIYRRVKSYDGFVVIHGFDKVLYTAAAVSFLVQNLTKPVIFSGGRYISSEPTNAKNLGVKANLINALHVATYSLFEVGLMFGNRLLRASQSERIYEESLNAFTAPVSGMLGRIDFSIRIFDKLINHYKNNIKFHSTLGQNIEIIDIEPLLDFKALAKRVVGKAGIIINAGNCQGLPTGLITIFKHIAPVVPIVVWSKEAKPSVFDPKNLILVGNMTWPTTVVKLMWALGQTNNCKKIRDLIKANIAGEIMN